MKRLLIILGVLAGVALIEAPDDYIWKGFEDGTTIQITDARYDWQPNLYPSGSDAVDSDHPAKEVAGEKI